MYLHNCLTFYDMWRSIVVILSITMILIGCNGSDYSDNGEESKDTAEMDTVVLDTNPSTPLSPEEIAEKAFPSVVLLVMQDQNRQPISLGSGFLVDENIIATNLHILNGASRGYAKLVGQEEKYEVEGALAVDPKHDLALLRTSGIDSKPLNLDSTRIDVGSEVYAVGNPSGLEGTFSEGIVSGIRNFEGDNVLQITAPISPGSSGGPVLNPEGEVVGIATATFENGQNLNFAVPSEYVTQIYNDIGNITPLRSVSGSLNESVFVNIEEPSETITANQFLWNKDYNNEYERDQEFTFSVRNHGNNTVKDVLILVIFHNSNGDPIDSQFISYEGFIPPGLAKRVGGSTDYSVKDMTTGTYKNGSYFRDEPFTEVEFRILDFKVAQ